MRSKKRKLPRPRKPATAAREFPIVGVGASAGGLEAFTKLLSKLPTDTGFGYVLVQHLDPQHESALAQLLTRATSMPVHEVTNNQRVEPNHVYIIPPNTILGIESGILKLQPRSVNRAALRSIDFFLEALAKDRQELAIGVILSGTATDGTLGLEAIKAAGGLTFAQDESARFDSMPHSAVAAGCVDLVLAPEQIARELARIATHPYIAGRRPGRKTPGGSRTPAAMAGADEPDDLNSCRKILLLLRNHCGVDFSLYKSTTINRRIARRTVLNRRDTLEHYADFLRGNVKELEALYSDVLISVTSFFRNAAAFETLKHKVFPGLLKQRGDEPVRVWVLGCSTGQEAYSIAMAFAEVAEKIPRTRSLQVFATDLNEANLEKARHGLYAKGITQDVSPERRRRFFVEEEGGYRIIKALREQVVFARQNLISDPPFSRMDLICCRNLMIYLEPGLQKKALAAFHYALKAEGFLFLGASESVGDATDLFTPVDKKQKIFARKSAATIPFQLPIRSEPGERRERGPTPGSSNGRRPGGPADVFRGELNAEREADRVTLIQFAPPAVLIDANLQIVQFRGATGAFLEPPTGKARFDLLKMAREGLMLPLRATINQARKTNQAARKKNVPLRQNGRTRNVNLEVIPLTNLKERRYLVLFGEAENNGDHARGNQSPDVGPPAPPLSRQQESSRITSLEAVLAETRDYLQAIQEHQEASNEELQASNEESQSANEELQSLNEELETSKEELESTNEELTTVNEEMAGRNTELFRLNSDLTNLQTSANLIIVLLGRDLTIRRFSAEAEKQFNLLASDVGRPISRVRHNLNLPDLEAVILQVIARVREFEREVQSTGGRWYSVRIRPYLTIDNKVDGAVLVLTDIDALKQTEKLVSDAHAHAAAIIRTVHDPLVVLTTGLRIQSANEAFHRTFKLSPAETRDRSFFELEGGTWNIPRLRHLLENIVPHNRVFDDFEVTRSFKRIGRRSLRLNARLLKESGGRPKEILLGFRDVTEQNRAGEALRTSEQRFRALFDLGPVGVYFCDPTGAIQNFNQCAATLWGRKPRLGASGDRFCGSFKMFRPDGTLLPPKKCPMAGVLSGRIPEARDAEVLLERKDGSRITAIANIVPLKNERGEIMGAINCFYDITERKRAQEKLREADVLLSRHANKLEKTVTRRTAQLTVTNRRLEAAIESTRASEERTRALLVQSELMQKHLRRLTRQILTAQEEERKKISRELHDDVVQTLVGINVELSALVHGNSAGVRQLKGRITRTQRLVEKSVDSVHRFARELRPAVLDDLGLIPALHTFCKGLARRKKLKIHLTAFGGIEAMAGDKRTVLYRVAQEALTNVARHARATQVKLSIVKIPGAARMEVTDNGRSFPVRKFVVAKSKRLGLVGMKERVEMVGGTLTIESAPGRGTTIRAEIPFKPEPSKK